jgi:hypothetical protein
VNPPHQLLSELTNIYKTSCVQHGIRALLNGLPLNSFSSFSVTIYPMPLLGNVSVNMTAATNKYVGIEESFACVIFPAGLDISKKVGNQFFTELLVSFLYYDLSAVLVICVPQFKLAINTVTM